MNKRWIYDIETFKNLFLIVFKNTKSGEIRKFQVSPLGDDRVALVSFLKNEVEEMVGYNNLAFDYPVLDYFIKKLLKVKARDAVMRTFEKAQSLISNNVEPWRNYIRKPIRKQIDLFKIHHFDNPAKRTSLKMLEFVMKMDNIQELPFDFNKELTMEGIEEVIAYCENDVEATEELYKKTLDAIDLRNKLKDIYHMDMTNHNDTKIGQDIFVSVIKKQMDVEKIGKTPRESINLRDIIFPSIEFKEDSFNTILEWFKNQVITETKGVFSGIPLEKVTTLIYSNLEEKPKGHLKVLNTMYKGFQYDYGLGGIHGSVAGGVYEPDEDSEMRDIDVASYYPNIAIANDLYPEHLSQAFCEIYKGVYEERKKYPKKTHLEFNQALKLALNGVYGKSNSEHSPFYDPLYTMSITINGQLLLCMLSEWLLDIPNLQMIQINTDGMTVIYPKTFKTEVDAICKRWEELTNLELEDAYYTKMVIRDVNNYLAIYENGDVKRKGVFDYNLDLHQNHSMLVIPKAIEAYFVEDKPIEEFIRRHRDMYDFFKRTKLDRRSRLEGRVFLTGDNSINVLDLQRITRYYIANRGVTLIKVMPPLKDKVEEREFNIESGYTCVPVNNLSSIKRAEIFNNLNYGYYIDEAYKITKAIEK